MAKKHPFSQKFTNCFHPPTIRCLFFQEILREKITEKHVAVQLEEMKAAQAEPSEKAVNYRRQIEELSRYLSRDSRRYDGYFEMY